MLGKSSFLWRALKICGIILSILFFGLFINILIWFINFFGDYWLHHKSSPEVDGALTNALFGSITILLTIAVSLWFNLKTQELMEKQLKISEQQLRTSLRDLVYENRMKFYLELMEKIHKIGEESIELIRNKEYKKFIGLLDDLEALYNKKRALASKKLRTFFACYKEQILQFGDDDELLDWKEIRFLNKILRDIEFVIELELITDIIDDDIYRIIEESKKEEIKDRLMKLHNEFEERRKKENEEFMKYLAKLAEEN